MSVVMLVLVLTVVPESTVRTPAASTGWARS